MRTTAYMGPLMKHISYAQLNMGTNAADNAALGKPKKIEKP